jgi:hypothetical protein
MKRFTVMGFTEAELGFVLAALFAALVASTLTDTQQVVDGEIAKVTAATAERDSLRLELETYRDSTSAQIGRLRDSLNAQKRSTKTPNCWERGEPRSSIAELAVLGANLYQHRGQAVDIQTIRRDLAAQIARSRQLECRYSVRARPTEGVGSREHSAAVARLREHFDVNDRP